MPALRASLLLLSSALSPTAQAGPWVRDLGHGYVKAGYSRFQADQFVQPDGSTVEGTEYLGQTTHLYGEVGVARGLQAVFNVPFVGSRNIIGDVSYINRWGGDLNAGLEYGRALGKLPVSLQVLSKLPLYDNADLAVYGDSSSRFPAIGDGQVDLTALLAVGGSFSIKEVRGWLAGELGYRHRSAWWLGDSTQPDRDYSDGIPWSAQLGWSPTLKGRDMGWLFLRADGIQNLRTDTVTQQLVQASVGGALKVTDIVAIELGYASIVQARNAAPGSGLNGGLSCSF
ncbi:MAG: hypothetical protein ACI8S6_003932 [Myxococcota bacterium]|jgi:hypothetical protein